MKRGMLIVMGLSIVGFLFGLLPVAVCAQEPAAEQPAAEQPAAEQPAASAPQPAESQPAPAPAAPAEQPAPPAPQAQPQPAPQPAENQPAPAPAPAAPAEQPVPPAAEAQPPQQPQPQPNETDIWKENFEEKHVKFIEWLRASYPDKAAELLAIQEKNPQTLVQKLGEIMAIYEPIQKADKCCPELAAVLRKDLDLLNQRDQLLGQIAVANGETRPELLNRLKELIAVRFDNIVQKKQLQYELLRKRLEELTQQLDKQAKELEQLKTEKDKLVEQHINELLTPEEKPTGNHVPPADSEALFSLLYDDLTDFGIVTCDPAAHGG